MSALCLAAPALAQSTEIGGDGSISDNDRLVPGIYPARPVLESGDGLAEPYDPFFDVDWSLALRGSYTKGTEGERFDVRLVPEVMLEHTGSRSFINAQASAEVVRPTQGQIDVSGLRLSGNGGYALDRDTALTAGGGFSVAREVAGMPGVASNISTAPQTITGGGDVGITRQFGKFNVGLTGTVDRTVYGPTTLTGGAVVDNADQDVWSLEGGLRVGFQVTPVFEVFGRAGLGRDLFDRTSASLGLRPDATTTTLEGGVTGRWSSVLEATASTGVALRRFDAASLGEVSAQLYDARISFVPDPTLRMSAGFATTVAPPGPSGSGSTRIGYAATADVAYTVNSWLALRAQANWGRSYYVGSGNTETGYRLGAGGDYTVNAHTALTADYNFDQSTTVSSGVQHAHQMTVGIKLSR